MKKLVPLCLATLAMTAAACSDDDGAVVPVDTPDGSVQTTEAPADSTQVSDSTAPASSDAGNEDTSSAPSVIDAGGDESSDVDAGSELDSGISSGDVGDSGPTTQGDAGDGGAVWSAQCVSACAAAATAGCEDNAQCELDLCESMYYIGPACIAEADAYLACVGETASADDFVCSDDERPEYVGADCDEVLYAWLICFSG